MRSSSKTSIVGVGELLWDMLPSGPRLGGTTANFAILTSRLGDSVSLVSRVGDDALGRQAMAQLQIVAQSVSTTSYFDLSAIQLSPDLPTGTVDVTLDANGRPTYTIVDPVAWDQICPEEALAERAEAASAICFGTLAQRHNPSRDTVRAMVRTTSPSCIRVCDVNLRPPFCDAETIRWCMDHATVLKISDEELPAVARLLGLESKLSVPDFRDFGEPLTAWATHAAHLMLEVSPGCSMVAITLGPHGSVLVTPSSGHRHPGFPVKVVDTIGAGDAFTAGMVHAYTRQAPLEQVNIVSNLCGSYVASQPGATPELPPSLLAAIEKILTA
jgi:fructokinase